MASSSSEDSVEQETLLDRPKRMQGRCSELVHTKSARLLSMLALIFAYFLAEIIVGNIANSLTLVADSFHMLSDGFSLIVGLVAIRMSKRTADKSITAWPSKQRYFNTFGWVRFEVVGALINATFLLALCLSIMLEAVEKFLDPRFVSQPLLVLIVGIGGLAINLIGLCMFGGDAHGGHDHGHGGHHHGKSKPHRNSIEAKANGTCQNENVEAGKSLEVKASSETQMNMQAVFLHVLGDALGSVIVIISAGIVLLVEHDNDVDEEMLHTCNATTKTTLLNTHENHWIVYIDPTMSVLLVIIVAATTVPLFWKSSLILLQTVPKNIRLDSIKKQVQTIDGVHEIHEFHVWQLAGDKLVATVHVQCSDVESYLQVASQMKIRLHDEGIHSLTIQPEFKKTPSKHCSMACPSDTCKGKVCCEIIPDKKKKHFSNGSKVARTGAVATPNVAPFPSGFVAEDPSSTSHVPSDDGGPETIV